MFVYVAAIRRFRVRASRSLARAQYVRKRRSSCFSSVVIPTLPSVSPSMVHEEKEWTASLEESRLESCEFVARAALEFADTSGSVAPHNFDISTLRTAEEECATRPFRCT